MKIFRLILHYLKYMRLCDKCGGFERHKNGQCKECKKTVAKAWSVANPRKRKDSMLKFRYGITLQQYEEMLESQGGKCYICLIAQCSSGRSLSVDHNHKTEKVRGLLCKDCNKALGLFRDDANLMRRAASYVELS